MINVQKWQFLAISEDWTIVYAGYSFELIINNEFLVYIKSLYFALIIYYQKLYTFTFHNFEMEQGQFRRSWP